MPSNINVDLNARIHRPKNNQIETLDGDSKPTSLGAGTGQASKDGGGKQSPRLFIHTERSRSPKRPSNLHVSSEAEVPQPKTTRRVEATDLSTEQYNDTLNLSDHDSSDSDFLNITLPALQSLDLPTCFCIKGAICPKH